MILGQYEGTVRIAAPGLPASPQPVADARAVFGGVPLQRTRFELIVERKLRRRQLTEDGNVEIVGRDSANKNLRNGGAESPIYLGVVRH